MKGVTALLAPLRRLDLDRLAAFRPAYPPVAIEVDRREMTLVRLKKRRGAPPVLEAHQARSMPENTVGSSVFRPNLGSPDEIAKRVKLLLESSGTRPGKISLVLPDNLAKVSLVSLPERPPSRKQLLEILRFKLRRSVPYRLEDAVIAHQVVDGESGGLNLLVAIMLRSVVEQYEAVLEAAGARPGLVDLCTLSLYNLARREIAKGARDGGDTALLNCAPGYFTLVIFRGQRLVFYRCKAYAATEGAPPLEVAPLIAREMATSLSYYQEKLEGQGISTVHVRAVTPTLEEISAVLAELGVAHVVPLDPLSVISAGNGSHLDPLLRQQLAPALGAAAGRSI